MREVDTGIIETNISEMCIEANIHLSEDVRCAVLKAYSGEKSEIGRGILDQLRENMEIADNEQIPICQDTGMAVVFIDVGQEVLLTGKYIEDAINDGIRDGYEKGFLRKSVVDDPLIVRKNTNDNTPGIIHYRVVPGSSIDITVAPKGFGSENMSRIFMLKPSDGIEGAKKAVIEAVRNAGANACPPMFIGIGIGGDFEKCAIMAKRALTRPCGSHAENSGIARLEEELFEELNRLGIGPSGFGGNTSVLGVNIETYPTHIAGMPLAVNICCHVNRHVHRTL